MTTDCMGLLDLLSGANRQSAAIDAIAIAGSRMAVSRASNSAEMKPATTRRISGAGTRITSGAIESLDQNTLLRGSKWYGSPGSLGIAQKMIRDAHVRQSLSAVYSPLLAASWKFRPASDSAIDREVADFLQWAIIERLQWNEILKRVILDYCTAGFSLNEITEAVASTPRDRFPMHRGGGSCVVPGGFYQIPTWTIYGWLQNESNPSSVSGVEQYVQGSDGEEMGWRTIPSDRFLRWTWDQDGANYEGLAVLRTAYASWKMKVAFQTLAAIKHERLAVPTPVAIASENATDEDVSAVETILEEMRANARGYVVLDNGWSMSWDGATSSDGSNIEAAISQCNQDIAYNVGAGFMVLGLTTTSGSYALGATQQGQYHLQEQAHAKFVAGIINNGPDGWSLVERLVRLNYGSDVGLPRLEVRNLPTANWQDRIPLLINAANVGLVRRDAVLESAIREALEFDEFDPDSELMAKEPVELITKRSTAKEDENDEDK